MTIADRYVEKFGERDPSDFDRMEAADYQAEGYKKYIPRYVWGGLALVGAAAIAFGGNSSAETRTEACVSDLVGKDINLVRSPGSDQLIRPAEILAELRACGQAGGDPDLAKTIVR